MAILNSVPKIWASRILVSLKKNLVYGAPDIASRAYEGEIAQRGDSVTITSVGRPTVSDYTPNTTTITYEELTDAERTLIIDQSKFFSFVVEDTERRQSTVGYVDEAVREASYALRDTADQFIAGLYTGVQSANDLGTVAVTTGDLAYTQLVNLKVKLDEANVRTEGRWVVVPPWYHGLLLDSAKFIDASAAGTTEGLRNGRVGRAAGFDIRVSNNVPLVTGDDYAVMSGVSGAIAFAEQIASVRSMPLEGVFGAGWSGLHLYGAKLVRPDSIATVTASKT